MKYCIYILYTALDHGKNGEVIKFIHLLRWNLHRVNEALVTVQLNGFYNSLDSKENQPVHPKGNQSWIFMERMDAEAEAPVLWPPDATELTHWKRPWCWKTLKAGGEGDDRGWDGWMASPTRWTMSLSKLREPKKIKSVTASTFFRFYLSLVDGTWCYDLSFFVFFLMYREELMDHRIAISSTLFTSIQLHSHVWLFVTPWTAARQASLSITNSRSSLKHWVSDAVQTSPPLSSPSPMAFNLS